MIKFIQMMNLIITKILIHIKWAKQMREGAHHARHHHAVDERLGK